MTVTVVDHPLAAARLTQLRDSSTEPGRFRQALRDLSGFVVYEATRGVETEPVEVTTPLATPLATTASGELSSGLGLNDPR